MSRRRNRDLGREQIGLRHRPKAHESREHQHDGGAQQHPFGCVHMISVVLIVFVDGKWGLLLQRRSGGNMSVARFVLKLRVFSLAGAS